MTYRQAYEFGILELQANKILDYDIDARLLLEYVCNTKRQDLIINPNRELTNNEFGKYKTYISKRGEHYPLQYIIGQQDFMGLTFEVNENVLIPRLDTEFVVEEALKVINDGMSVLDVCTGSGCILLSILKYNKNCMGMGVDISTDALSVAINNSKRLNLMAEFVESDLFENVTRKFNIIISNPPYIRSDVIPTLMQEVKDYEPMIALDGLEDGLYFYREIIKDSMKYMQGGAWLIFEIGNDQGIEVRDIMLDSGFLDVVVKKDYTGNDRLVMGHC